MSVMIVSKLSPSKVLETMFKIVIAILNIAFHPSKMNKSHIGYKIDGLFCNIVEKIVKNQGELKWAEVIPVSLNICQTSGRRRPISRSS
mmetsp:Transcript_27072/g.26712  ORF Transcript_27072/g.26712 Transcript_27072/m.26712 type:complete len:89 (-) Transcript_27072:2212-2478(-)